MKSLVLFSFLLVGCAEIQPISKDQSDINADLVKICTDRSGLPILDRFGMITNCIGYK